MKTDPRERHVEYGSRRLSYQLRIVDRKRLRIVVRPDLSVLVDSPAGFSEEEIAAAVRTKGRWLVKQLDEIAAFHPLPKPYRFVSGETLVYLGRQYRLRVTQGEAAPAKLKGRYLEVTVADKKDAESVRSVVEAWYRHRAEDRFGRSFEQCMKIAERHGAKRPTLAIRKMRTRWGSCTAEGRMTLNLYLIQAPVHCIDYVVIHELCHTVEHNHSKAFYRLMTRCMPDWEHRKAVLNGFSVREL
jgi:predicted metal-dependent hydrolase